VGTPLACYSADSISAQRRTGAQPRRLEAASTGDLRLRPGQWRRQPGWENRLWYRHRGADHRDRARPR